MILPEFGPLPESALWIVDYPRKPGYIQCFRGPGSLPGVLGAGRTTVLNVRDLQGTIDGWLLFRDGVESEEAKDATLAESIDSTWATSS